MRPKRRATGSKLKTDAVFATEVFDDPYAVAEQDRFEGGEPRWRSIGMAAGIAVLVVGHTVRG